MRKQLTFVLLLMVLGCGAQAAAAQGSLQSTSADAVVRQLYKVHGAGDGILSAKSRKNLDRFFERKLADTIWRELTRPPSDDVGNLDFDPLYNAQDILLRGFRVGRPLVEGRRASVLVTFSNAGRRERIKFLLRDTEGGWKVENLVYSDGSDLLKILNETH